MLQLSWVFSILTETSQTPGPLHRNQSSEWKGPSEHVSRVCGLKHEGLGSVYWTESCDTFWILRLAFIWAHQNWSQSHFADCSSFPRFPMFFFFSFFFSFHPLLMCRTLILNTLFPVFWSADFTCRWAGNLHQLKGLPSLLMLSDKRSVYSSSRVKHHSQDTAWIAVSWCFKARFTPKKLLRNWIKNTFLQRKGFTVSGIWWVVRSDIKALCLFRHKVTPSVILSRAESISQTPLALWIPLQSPTHLGDINTEEHGRIK